VNETLTPIGASDDQARLRIALVRSPLDELRRVDPEPWRVLWNAVPDDGKARQQHRVLTNILRHSGVEVIQLNGPTPYANLCFCRDQIVTLPTGLLVAKCATRCRAGEPQIAVDRLRSIGVETLPAVQAAEAYEGGDFLLAGDGVLLAGCSTRTSAHAIDTLRGVVSRAGVKIVIPIHIPRRFLHLDCAVLAVGKTIVAAFALDPATQAELRRNGFTVQQIPESWCGDTALGLNALFLDRNLALVSESMASPLVDLLHRKGVDTIRVNVSEFEKGGGGLHCLVAAIHRANTV
jgi:N-dimethylarginine dimethylaminohydrolase